MKNFQSNLVEITDPLDTPLEGECPCICGVLVHMWTQLRKKIIGNSSEYKVDVW